jgi:hypothetical protein
VLKFKRKFRHPKVKGIVEQGMRRISGKNWQKTRVEREKN